jgi:A/G-specific adenine glycosylase
MLAASTAAKTTRLLVLVRATKGAITTLTPPRFRNTTVAIMGKTTQPTLAAFAKRAAAAVAAPAPGPPIDAQARPAMAKADAAVAAEPGGGDALPRRTNSSDQRMQQQQQQQQQAEPSPARAAKKLKVEEEVEEVKPQPKQEEEEANDAAAKPPPPPRAAPKKTPKTKKPDSQSIIDPAYAFDEADRVEFRAHLLDWYDRGHRVLPWRRNPFSRLADKEGGGANAATTTTPTVNPAPPESELPAQQFAYRVWVSEIMLQQTQVATVIPYFQRWIARWPTVAALASATEEEVNELWAGLGYYRRARYLLSGAKHVVDNLSGSFPETAEEMRAIPGVGPYTAAAVASIAFGDGAVPSAAAVDGNVIRVVSRLRAVKGDPTKLANLHASLAGQLLDPERPGCHNQAMMELGATVCRPQQPECGACPVAAFCLARGAVAAWEEENKGVAPPPPVTAYPEKAAKAAKREQAVAVCVLRLVREGNEEGEREKTKKPAAGSLAAFVRRSSAAGGGLTAAGGEAAALSAAGPAGTAYLLVQRPAQGLLAGLWECPAVVLSDGAGELGGGGGGVGVGGGGGGSGGAAVAGSAAAAPSRSARRAALDELLGRLLGEPYRRAVEAAAVEGGGGSEAAAGGDQAAPSLRLVSRRDLGSAVHVFSHIRQTMHVEALTLAVRGGGAGGEGGFAAAAAALFESGGGGEGAVAAAAAAPPSSSRPNNTNHKNKRPASETETDEPEADDEATQSDEGAAGGAAAAAPSHHQAVRWVGGDALADTGLTTGVRKALAMAAALGGGGSDAKKRAGAKK